LKNCNIIELFSDAITLKTFERHSYMNFDVALESDIDYFAYVNSEILAIAITIALEF